MTRNLWLVAILSLVSASAVPENGIGQVPDPISSLLGKGACEVFGRRGFIDDATRQGCCRAFNVGCPEGVQGGFGGGTSQSQGFSGGTSSPTGASTPQGWGGERNANTRAADNPTDDPPDNLPENPPENPPENTTGQAQSVVDALGVFGGGANPTQGSSAPQGGNVGRNTNTRTPEQDYAVKTSPYFFEDKSKYPQSK